MLLRMLSVMLIALAMLAAPLTMREGAAMAAPAAAAMHHGDAAAQHHGPAKTPGHCDEQSTPNQDKSHKAMADNCCVATCVAAVAPTGAANLPVYHPLAERPTSDTARLGTLAEIATPPPRHA